MQAFYPALYPALPLAARLLGVLALVGAAVSLVGADEAPTPPGGARGPGCEPPAAKLATGSKAATGGRDLGQMHNVHEITPRFLRGSQPTSETDFAELAKLGVKVVVSVDGALPNVEAARKHGLRYVHVPMGYDGPSRADQIVLYRAFTTLEGPFYVHCHHGRHRGPAAIAIGLLTLDHWTGEQCAAELKRAGTAPKYEGLYALVREFEPPSAVELAAAPAELPESAPVRGLQAEMVHVDHGWERVGFVRQADWKVPPHHPDVSPRHEATILAERYRELARLDEDVKAKPELLRLMRESEAAAWDLAKALGAATVDRAAAQAAYARIETLCTACHQAFRDTPAVAGSR